MDSKRVARLLPYIIAAAVAGMYLLHINNDFIYDDTIVILKQEPVRSMGDVARIFTEQHYLNFTYYRPITRMTLLLQKTWHGENAVPFHSFNAILIGLYALILIKLFSLPVLGIRQELAYTAAVFCALHPVASEVVYPIASGRETLLSSVFVLFALYAYLKPERYYFALASVSYLLSLFCKEQAIMLPLVFVAADSLGLSGLKPGKNLRVWSVKYSVVGAITLSYLLIRQALFNGSEYALNQVILGPILAMVYALQVILAPTAQLIYEPTGSSVFSLPRLVFVVLVLGVLVWHMVKRWTEMQTLILFWAIFFIAFLLPTANFIQQDASYSERYVFVSMVGLMAIIFNVLSACWKPATWKYLLGIVVALTLAAAGMTYYRGSFYVDNLTFYGQWVKTSPDNPSAHNGYGNRLRLKGKLPEAIRHLKYAADLSPAEPYPLYNLALLYYENLKQYDTVLWYIDRVLANDPTHIIVDAFMIKAEALNALGRDKEALEWYGKYLGFNPKNTEALYASAKILEKRGEREHAKRLYQQVMTIDSKFSDTKERQQLTDGRNH